MTDFKTGNNTIEFLFYRYSLIAGVEEGFTEDKQGWWETVGETFQRSVGAC